MTPLTHLQLGLFLPGNSPLHRCDPRLKLLAVPALVAATFAAGKVGQLFVLTLVALGAWLLSRLPWATWGRTGRTLRWLFLFTLVVHTLFSPGRTLFGQSWLSADGLLTGLLTCWRLALALGFVALLSATTPPAGLAGALAALLRPLEKLRVPVRDWAEILMLVLHFIPVFREEAQVLQGQPHAPAAGGKTPTLLDRAAHVRRLLVPLLLRLVERADRLAWQLAAGAGPAELTELSPGPPLRPAVLIFFLAGALLLAVVYRGLA
jgi:energy-coupling factor transport system permease protein